MADESGRPDAVCVVEAKGQGGQVTFDGEYVTITRKGLLARAGVGKGEKRIHISQISAVQWKQPGSLVNGFIQFTLPGGNERRSRFGSQSADAANDENSVMVTKRQAPAFEELRAAINEAIAQRHQPAASTASSVADELLKLHQLLGAGAISIADYEAAKAKLLNP